MAATQYCCILVQLLYTFLGSIQKKKKKRNLKYPEEGKCSVIQSIFHRIGSVKEPIFSKYHALSFIKECWLLSLLPKSGKNKPKFLPNFKTLPSQKRLYYCCWEKGQRTTCVRLKGSFRTRGHLHAGGAVKTTFYYGRECYTYSLRILSGSAVLLINLFDHLPMYP